jgi:hypothetical protein
MFAVEVCKTSVGVPGAPAYGGGGERGVFVFAGIRESVNELECEGR